MSFLSWWSVKAENNGYPAKNKMTVVLTPDNSDYVSGNAPAMAPASLAPWGRLQLLHLHPGVAPGLGSGITIKGELTAILKLRSLAGLGGTSAVKATHPI